MIDIQTPMDVTIKSPPEQVLYKKPPHPPALKAGGMRIHNQAQFPRLAGVQRFKAKGETESKNLAAEAPEEAPKEEATDQKEISGKIPVKSIVPQQRKDNMGVSGKHPIPLSVYSEHAKANPSTYYPKPEFQVKNPGAEIFRNHFIRQPPSKYLQ